MVAHKGLDVTQLLEDEPAGLGGIAGSLGCHRGSEEDAHVGIGKSAGGDGLSEPMAPGSTGQRPFGQPLAKPLPGNVHRGVGLPVDLNVDFVLLGGFQGLGGIEKARALREHKT